MADDMDVKKVKNAKAKLENYVTMFEIVLSEDFGKMKIEEKKQLEDAAEHTIQWLEWNCELTNHRKFEDKLEELKDICDPLMPKTHP